MSDNFAAQVEAWVAESEELLKGVFHESVQRVVDKVEEVGPSKASIAAAIAKGAKLGKQGRNNKKAFGPVASGGSGHMPVDTGYLRASLSASTESMPVMREDAVPTGASYSYSSGPVNLVINGADLGQTIYCGFVAAYAARLNYGFTGEDSRGRSYSQQGYYFVELATQQWPQIVDQVQAELKERMGGT